MKLILAIAFLAVTISGYSQTKYNWLGSYSYTVMASKTYVQGTETLVIETTSKKGKDYQFTINAEGKQMFYELKGYVINKGTYLDFYLDKVEGGYAQEERIDKTKPFFKMMISKEQVLTKWVQPEAQKAFHVYFKPD